jgi:hypothetical protein
MSKELDSQIDGLRDKLIEDSKTPIGMGNARQKLRTAQEIALGILNVVDELNAQSDSISPAVLDKLKAAMSQWQNGRPEGDK